MKDFINKEDYPLIKYSIIATILIFVAVLWILSKIHINEKSIIELAFEYYYK